MRWYYDLKISVKLISAFVVVAVLGGLVGVFGIINPQNLGNEDVKLYEKNTLAVVNMDEIQADFLRVRVGIRLAMNNDGTNKSQTIADAKTLMDKIDKNITKSVRSLDASHQECNGSWLGKQGG